MADEEEDPTVSGHLCLNPVFITPSGLVAGEELRSDLLSLMSSAERVRGFVCFRRDE